MNKENPNSLLSLLTVHSLPKTILLVEDEPAIVFLESKILKKNGYKVITAQNAEKAVEIVNNNESIDLILMDIDLGIGMDGAETAQEILKNHDIPVVFLSSHSEPEVIEKVDKITSYGYILKDSPDTVLIASIKMAFKLHEANEKHKKIFNESPDGLCLADPETGIIVDCNKAFTELVGRERSELIGTSQKILHPPINDNSRFTKTFEQQRNGEEVHFLETQVITKTGQIKDVELKAYFIEVNGKKFLQGIFHDITDRKLTEKMIQACLKLVEFPSHHSLNELLQKTLDEICIITDSPIGFYHFVEADQKTLSLQEWSTRTLNEYCKAEGKGLHYPLERAGVWAECVHQRKPLIHNDYASLTHKKGLPEGHAEIVRELVVPIIREGLVVAILGVGNKTQDYNEKDIEIVSYFADVAWEIAEKKQTEESLSRSERLFRAVVENNHDGIIMMSSERKTIYVSPSYKQISGYSSEEWIDKYGPDFIHPDDQTITANIFREVLQTPDKVLTGTYRLRHKMGHWFWVETTLTNLLHDPVIQAIVLNSRDITERKRMEEELQKTQKLESLGVLAGGIAHDFNNLIGGIYGYIDIANIKSKDEHTMQYLSKAMNTIDRAKDLTRQLLTFAKGGAPIQKVTSLIPFIRETVNFSLSGSDISCRFDIPESLWQCNIDKNQISQVIGNIIINSKQAMPGGGTIEVSAGNISLDEKGHLTLEKGNYVKISIKDYGIGIPKEIISKVFDPFFTTKSFGHGLGLTTCYSIIKRHGGGINVESESDKGTTFHIYLPASVESGTENETPVVVKHDGKGTFIVMDDEEVIRDIMKSQLEMLGYSVVCTNDGRKAIDFLIKETEGNNDISAMILDLTISGGMGGKTAIAEIRKLNTEIPVFVVSGYADDPVIKNPAGYGFTDSLCKPFRISELSKMLNKHLK